MWEVLHLEDNCIIDLYFSRDEDAITQTEIKYGNYCYCIAHNILSNREDSLECVNDTYYSAWNAMPPQRPSVLSSFLGKITRRISIDKFRKNTAQKRGMGEMPLTLDELLDCVSDTKDVASEIEMKNLTRVINDFVKKLPETEQKIFICRYWYVDSIADIGEQLGFSQSKIKSILFRTREKLRVTLKKEGYM